MMSEGALKEVQIMYNTPSVLDILCAHASCHDRAMRGLRGDEPPTFMASAHHRHEGGKRIARPEFYWWP